jgi:hypothetical protein
MVRHVQLIRYIKCVVPHPSAVNANPFLLSEFRIIVTSNTSLDISSLSQTSNHTICTIAGGDWMHQSTIASER